jgi:hypothetical protein
MTDTDARIKLLWMVLNVGLKTASSMVEAEPNDLCEIEVLCDFFETSARTLADLRDHIRANA